MSTNKGIFHICAFCPYGCALRYFCCLCCCNVHRRCQKIVLPVSEYSVVLQLRNCTTEVLNICRVPKDKKVNFVVPTVVINTFLLTPKETCELVVYLFSLWRMLHCMNNLVIIAVFSLGIIFRLSLLKILFFFSINYLTN